MVQMNSGALRCQAAKIQLRAVSNLVYSAVNHTPGTYHTRQVPVPELVLNNGRYPGIFRAWPFFIALVSAFSKPVVKTDRETW